MPEVKTLRMNSAADALQTFRQGRADAYTHDADQEHLPAWRAFNRASRRHPDAVGIWHETYAVRPGGVETVYVGGACVGLGAATGTVPVERRGRTARERLDGGDRLTPAS